MYRLLLASLTLTAAPAAFAQDAMTQLGAHVHGESNLSVGLDPASGDLLIEMTGPAYNLYGFEREPANEAESQIIAARNAAITRDGIFALSTGAGCQFTASEIAGDDAHDHDGHDHGEHHHDDHDHHDHADHEGHDHSDHDHGNHDHSDHGHGDHQDHEHHDHGRDEHDHGGGDEHNHSDVRISWTYVCDAPAALTRIDAANLFEALPSLERLDAQFFDGERAAAQNLTAARSAITIE